MAVLETIRVKLGILITVLIAVALLSFIIDPTTLQSVSSSMSSKYDVGEIDGKSISYNDFQADIEKFTAINEIISGSSVSNEQQQIAVRNEAWQSLVDKYLFIKNAQAAGINVGDEEMVKLLSGEIDSPVFTQNPAFFDENGRFSKSRVLEFVNYIESDQTGRLKLYWDYLQESAKTQQYYSKYMSLFAQSNVINPLMLTERIAENNNTFDLEFVMVPFGYAKDSTIVVSDKEIKNYYESHKKFYKQKASRDIEYVVFEVVPSAEDVAAANQSLIDVYDEFASSTNMKSFLMANSDRQYDDRWYKEGELRSVAKEINDFAFGGKQPVSDVISKDNVFYAARVMDTAMVPDSVYVRHILLQGTDVTKADSLINVLKSRKNTFAAVAEEYSADNNQNVPERGDIGWMTQTYMIPGFESVLTAKVGEISVLNTQYGKHIVEVTKRTAPIEKKKVAILEKGAVASRETINTYYSQANDLAIKSAGKYENFRNAVQEGGLYAHPVKKMLEGADRLGSIENAKEVSRWAFENKVGKVSNIITVNNNYFVIAAVTGIHKEGYADISEVSASISNILYSEKAGQKKAEEIAEKINGLSDMNAIAEALSTTVSTKEGVAFSSMTSQGLDPKFIGAASVAQDGVICGPVAGNIGVYVYRVTGRDTGAFYTEDDAKARESQLAQYSAQMIVPTMMDDADVVDNRARFF